MTFNRFALVVAMMATLAACGGGGGSDAPAAPPPPAPAADKYVGVWASCQPVTGATNGVLSVKTKFTFTKAAVANTLTVSVDGEGYKQANCAGAVFNSLPALATGSMSPNGTKVIGSDTVDKLDFNLKSTQVAELNGSFKDIGLVANNTLKFGSGTFDAQGYPNALDNVDIYTKQ